MVSFSLLLVLPILPHILCIYLKPWFSIWIFLKRKKITLLASYVTEMERWFLLAYEKTRNPERPAPILVFVEGTWCPIRYQTLLYRMCALKAIKLCKMGLRAFNALYISHIIQSLILDTTMLRDVMSILNESQQFFLGLLSCINMWLIMSI